MSNTTVSPFVVSDIEQVELSDGKGGKKVYWRKEILPNGKRKYRGKELDFSKINPSCIAAFDDGAVDQVPFVLALADNKHPETGQEIERLEGDLEQLELSGDGRLFGIFDLSQEVVGKIKKSNGKLGVSCRIDVGYRREDVDKEYDYALRHVCATTASHIKGMSPWEKVELSEEDKSGETLDLSTEIIEEEQKVNEKETGDDLVALEIPKDQFDKLMAFIGDMEAGEEVAKKLGEGEEETESARLSETDSKRIELAEQTARDANTRIELAERKAAQSEWKARRAELAREGVPPVILTEAEKVLSLHRRSTITLTEPDGKTATIDASEVIENILEHCKGIVPLSEEKGHSVTDANALVTDKEFEEFQMNVLSDLDY